VRKAPDWANAIMADAPITQIEARCGSVAAAHKLLGVSRTTWYEYRRGATALPAYIERSIRAHLQLPDPAFEALARE
jgi:LmbE family N-acetylglucosaminyl deacetylase